MTYKDNSGSRETESSVLSNETVDLDAPTADVAHKILWSCILRNNDKLAEAVNDDALASSLEQAAVRENGRELLDQRRTPGFEYRLGELHAANPRLLKGIKFHVYEHIVDGTASRSPAVRSIVWTFALVFDAHHTSRKETQLCINRMVASTKRFQCNELSLHATSAEFDMATMKHTLTKAVRQHMEEVATLGANPLRDGESKKTKASGMKKLLRMFRKKQKE